MQTPLPPHSILVQVDQDLVDVACPGGKLLLAQLPWLLELCVHSR